MTRALRGLHLHFEPTSGIAGDMAVAALVDLGVPAGVVTEAIGAMGVRGLKVRFEKRKRGAYIAKGFEVRWPGKGAGQAHEDVDAQPLEDAHPHPDAHAHSHEDAHLHGHDGEHRDYREVKRLLGRARLEAGARRLAGEIFGRIAEVEAKLHGTKVDRVAFHEVGAYDSIADVVGVAAAIDYLQPVSIGSLPPVVGTGRVRTAHGPVAVPAPATAALLEGIPVLPEGLGELTTPTGAAILAATVDRFGAIPPMRIRAVGYGAGTRELADRANVLRVIAGEKIGAEDAPAAARVVLLEVNIDDMNPQLVAPLFDALSAAGALDVWSLPILMKKGRPALMVSALAPPEACPAVERAFFLNSTTLGLRRRSLERVVLARAFEKVATPYGPVRVKLAALDGEVLGVHPEFDDCRRLAARVRVPVREVIAAASAAARSLVPGLGKVGRKKKRP